MRLVINFFALVCISFSVHSESFEVTEKCCQDTLKDISTIIEETISQYPMMIPAEKVNEITSHYDLKIDQLLKMLIPVARPYARSPISNYHVGAVALGKSGNIYFGVNLEFQNVPLNEAIHAEQFAITNARSHGEKRSLQ